MAEVVTNRLPTGTPAPFHTQTPWATTKAKIVRFLVNCIVGIVSLGAAITLRNRFNAKADLSITVGILTYIIAKYALGLFRGKLHPPEVTEIDIINKAIFEANTPYIQGIIRCAATAQKCVRVKAAVLPSIRTFLINPEGKLFVILNQTQKGDKIVGEGTQTKVKYCFELREQKFCTHASYRNKEAWEQATSILNQLKGTPNILQLLAADEYPSKDGEIKMKYSMVTEYCDQGDLMAVLKNSSIKADEKKEFCKKLAIALREVHRLGYVHGDLKPSNIFIKKEEGKLIPVLADFGLAREITPEHQQRLGGGTAPYLHPIIAKAHKIHKTDPTAFKEELKRLPSLTSRDIWALGAVFYLMQNQTLPWTQGVDRTAKVEEQLEQMQANLALLAESNTPAFEEPADKTSLEYLAWNMLQANPKKQFTLDQVIAFL